MSSLKLETKNKELKLIKEEEKNLNGWILLSSKQEII
jgi:hypothetical protein